MPGDALSRPDEMNRPTPLGSFSFDRMQTNAGNSEKPLATAKAVCAVCCCLQSGSELDVGSSQRFLFLISDKPTFVLVKKICFVVALTCIWEYRLSGQEKWGSKSPLLVPQLGCCRKMPRADGLNNRHILSFWRLEVQDRGASTFGFG